MGSDLLIQLTDAPYPKSTCSCERITWDFAQIFAVCGPLRGPTICPSTPRRLDMDELDLLAMDLREEFDQIPLELFELRHLWLRVILEVEIARMGDEDVTPSIQTPTSWRPH